MEKMVTQEISPSWNALKEVFQDKKVLVTGHTGFKGSWLTYMLIQLGAEVKGYALVPNTSPNLYDKLNLGSLCDSVIGDIRDQKKLTEEISSFQPEFVFHLAAQPLVRYSYKAPIETYEVNVMGTAYLLEALKTITGSCVGVMITTDKVYENKEWVFPYRENDPLGGYDPYSASKAACELVVGSMRNSFFHPDQYAEHQKSIATVRAGNVIGGGDWAEDRIIPDIVRSIERDKELELRNPYAIRPWEHVLDPLYGYLLLASKMVKSPLKYADAWNFGPGTDRSINVAELCAIAIDVWGKGSYKIIGDPKEPHEASNLKLDITKAIDILKWSPTWSSKKAIEKTVSWYKAYQEGGDVLGLVEDDIVGFFKEIQ